MHTDFDRLRSEARALDADHRAQLALDLLESLDAVEASPGIDKAWNDQAARRLAQADRREVQAISAQDVHASVEELLR